MDLFQAMPEEDEKRSRSFYVDLVDGLKNEEEIADFITLISTLNPIALEFALPSLCLLAVKNISDSAKSGLEKICADVFLDPESSRGGRKAAIACLKEIRFGNFWTEFYVLAEAIEEPQFHIIRPVLPRMDQLLVGVKENRIDFVWARIVILKALQHTNGWIRVWAIDKAIDIDAEILAKNYKFLPTDIIPNINNNDVFWRLLEKRQMTELLENFGKAIENVKNLILDKDEKVSFIRLFLESFEKLSSPASMFAISSILSHIQNCSILGVNDLTLLRRVILRARYIPQKSLRIVYIRNLVVFYAKICEISWKVLKELANLVAFIAHEATTAMVSNVYEKIAEVLKQKEYKLEDEEGLEEFLQNYRPGKNISQISRIWWIAMTNQREKRDLVASKIELRISEVLCSEQAENNEEIDCLVYLAQEKLEGMEINVLEMAQHQLGEHILKRVVSARGYKEDFELLESLYIPIFMQHCQLMLPGTIIMILPLISEEKSCERHCFLLTFLEKILKEVKVDANLKERIVEYLGGDDKLGMRRQMKSIDELEMKEFNKIAANLHALRLKMLNKFGDEEKVNVDGILEECIEQLDIASAFVTKREICEIMAKFVKKTSNTSLTISCIKACYNIVNEEKKSLNSLPALECFVKVALNSSNSDETLTYETIGLFENQLSIAGQSVQVALLIVKGISEHCENISQKWAEFIVKLAIFGPVPKKESRVLSFEYSKVFEEEEKGFLEKDDLERYDQVVQRARFQAVILCLKLAEKDESWAKMLTLKMIESMKLMDQSSSRSFGLSMAHRQKTRGVELLHLLISKIQDEKFIENDVFEYLVNCIIDPCQQFSIKLIVEWTICSIALRFERFFEKLVSEEFEKSLAENRIGSVSSWINILTLISRAKFLKQCLEKVVSWTSAQNFPVRCTAIAACRLMYNLLPKNKKKDYRIVKSIVNFCAEPSGNSKRVIDNLCIDFYFAKLDAEKHFDMQTIFIEISKKTGMPPEELIPVEIIEELNTSGMRSLNLDDEFLNAPSEVYSALMKNATSAPTMDNEGEEVYENLEESNENENQASSSSFQRKIVKEMDQKIDEEISLIVVASLVDKPTNLGGICRTCEIFGVDTLVVNDVLVAQDTNFRALSMSSENWQKIEGVRPQGLLAYLEELRGKGYTIIAVEQTTDSVMMHDFVFPKKAVIVMGDEKEGVPVNLLRAVDKTVEIKQVGHTRSLNVHVTAALLISKFAEQVRFK